MDSLKSALMQRKAKGGLTVTLNVGDDGSVEVRNVEKLDSEAPPPVEMQKAEEEGGEPGAGQEIEGLEGETDGEESDDDAVDMGIDDRELADLQAKPKLSLGERARMESAMKLKGKR